MAQHGYLREFDEGRDRDDDRERSEWRQQDDMRDRGEREARGSNRDYDRGYGRDYDRDRGFMFDDQDRNRDRDRGSDRGSDRDGGRGFFERMGDQARSWTGDDDRDHRSDRGAWENNGDWPQRNRGMSGSNESRGNVSNHPDDHYRSWRDRQMQALDRDYADYCREREQQFHSEFDSWRQNRQQQQGSGQNQQQAQGGGQNQDELLLAESRSAETGSTAPADQMTTTPSPEGEATLGTNNPANAGTGRGGRS
jgi:hypothetical protein